ncbi:MAG: 30S ribosomal protein S2 [Omnitrophica bacterium GWA2_52_8]|nr:MAG: 30S ribosomal protein S2 [Omnitrophica bacterium GWA2_52_8]
MSETTIKQLLEAGVHFGHQTQRWNPKMKKYIFGERNGIYIINLEITLSLMKHALDFLQQTAKEGKEILFIGTKRQAQQIVREAGESCGMPYVNQRWLGGMLTNFGTIRKSVARLDQIDCMEKDGSFQFLKKKESLMLIKEREKLLKNLLGIRKMKRLPGAIFVIDSKKEEIAIREAAKLGIPIVSIVDTNSDPDLIQFPIPGNDDAIRAIKLFCSLAAKAVLEGRPMAVVADTNVPVTEPVALDNAADAAESGEEGVGAADELPAAKTVVATLDVEGLDPALLQAEKLAEHFEPAEDDEEDKDRPVEKRKKI